MGHRGDDRSQSIMIGAVLLFGILIIAFSIYQAYGVPGQNRQVEFEHFTSTQDDMEQLRNAVIDAGQSEGTVTASVKLGTSYPMRLVAAQPQGSSGSLRTETIGNSTNELTLKNTNANLSSICGLDSLTTRAAVYQPSYNYLDSVSNVTYETTTTYTIGRQGGRALYTGQELIETNEIEVYPLLGETNNGGSGVASIAFRGGTTGKNTSVPGSFSLILPTRLSVSEWQDLLRDQTNVSSVSDVVGQQAVNITVTSGVDYDITCLPVGAGEAPNNDPSVIASQNGGETISPIFASGPSAPSQVTQGDNFTIAATFDDTSGRGGSDIFSASWEDTQGNSGAMNANDSEFDEAREETNATIDTTGWSLGTHTITVTGKDANGNTVSDTVDVEVTGGNPYLSDLKIFDNSDTNQPYKAKFDVEYTVQDPSGTFDRVEVTFDDTDAGSTTESSGALSDTISFEGGGQTANGNDYDIIVEVYDTDGNIVEDHTYTEPADGTDDNGDVI